MMASLENIESYLLALGLVLMIAELLLGFSIILLFKREEKAPYVLKQ
jgi:hypothetical protein